ncbi:MAG TPA: NAD(P)H-dependent oxidoreductase [Clostridia bacterium]|nr:NAD(P)H-dependent oxidoreductase [Clostridia bacterium]
MNKQIIGVVVGSARKHSFSRAVANYLISKAPENSELRLIDISGLPMYNQDLDGAPPAEWVAFRDQIRQVDGVLLVTPEHNRSFPALLKNALDVGSRPYGESVWEGKPGGVVSVSPGALGGFGANHHLRQVLAFLDIPVLPQPEAYVGNIASSLDESGAVANENLKGFLDEYLEALVAWVNRLSTKA